MVHTEHGYLSLQMWMSVRLKLTTATQMQSATIQEGHLLASATEMRYIMATGGRALITVSGQSLIFLLKLMKALMLILFATLFRFILRP